MPSLKVAPFGKVAGGNHGLRPCIYETVTDFTVKSYFRLRRARTRRARSGPEMKAISDSGELGKITGSSKGYGQFSRFRTSEPWL